MISAIPPIVTREGATRLARHLVVVDLALAFDAEIAAAKLSGAPCEELREAIEDAAEHYRERVHPALEGRDGILDRMLVELLAPEASR